MTRRLWVPFVPFLLVSALHLVALFTGSVALSTPTKWFLMPALLIGFIVSQFGPAQRRLVGELPVLGSIAILFSWAGDILIATPGDIGFLLGLGAFFLAHVAYLVLFLRPLKRRRVPLVALVLVVWWAVLLIVLAPYLGALLIPVAIYGIVLGASAAAALGTGPWVATGAVLFLASDTLLAFKLFLPDFAVWQADFLIMLMYLAGQGLIAYGAVRMRWAVGGIRTLAPEGFVAQ